MNNNDDPAKIVIIYDDPISSQIYDDFNIVTGCLACPRRIIRRGNKIQPGPFALSTWAKPNYLGLFMIFFLLILDRYMGQNPTFRPFFSPFICYFGPLYNPIIFYFRLFTVYLFFIFSFCVRWVPIVSFNQRVGPNHQVLTFSQLINNQCANQK